MMVSVPDQERGERLVVVHRALKPTPAEFWRLLHEGGRPNLYLPSEDSSLKVDGLSAIGTGKLDLRRITQMATEAFARS